MNFSQTHLHILHQPQDLSSKVKTGVSLHCHTEHSKEMLDFVPYYASRLPIVSLFWERERKNYLRREGHPWDFTAGYWTPPLNSTDVYNIEKKQINDTGLDAIISLTDHDEIEGNRQVGKIEGHERAPISLEWTVPFVFGFFHLGVHNLPEARADEITQDLLSYTFSETSEPDNARLHELFEMLNAIPDILIILNHPIWDIERAGEKRHNELLKKFIEEHGKWIHALEINGFRTWSENKAVMEMAESFGFPIATGGDRHGCKPNTVLNVTNKSNFSEFADEIRVSKHSEVVLMPEYMQPLHSRQMQSFSEILSHYPDFDMDRRQWFDRVFFDIGNEKGLVSLTDHGWDRGGPKWLRAAIWTLGFMGSRTMRPVFAAARKKEDKVPKKLVETKIRTKVNREIPTGLPSSPTSTSSVG